MEADRSGERMVTGGRRETRAFGHSKPVQPNTTAEGCQTIRRVELVKLP